MWWDDRLVHFKDCTATYHASSVTPLVLSYACAGVQRVPHRACKMCTLLAPKATRACALACAADASAEQRHGACLGTFNRYEHHSRYCCDATLSLEKRHGAIILPLSVYRGFALAESARPMPVKHRPKLAVLVSARNRSISCNSVRSQGLETVVELVNAQPVRIISGPRKKPFQYP